MKTANKPAVKNDDATTEKRTSSKEETSEKTETIKDEETADEATTTKSVKNDDEEPCEKNRKKPVKAQIQEKILAYFGQEMESDRSSVPKQEVAEGCNYASAGTHPFFYSWQDLEKQKKWIKKTSGKMFSLTEEGKKHIPEGMVIVAKPRDNASKQEYFLKRLLKQCKEAKAEKCKIMFRILEDGKWHDLDEFTKATKYTNLKSKGLGYAFTHMEKEMKILEKNGKEYRFTDKCFPEGRP